ncbi:MAG: acyl carrier protein [Planctomyces sp.]|nr:acyl carrier protein [Planctomyces sp.]
MTAAIQPAWTDFQDVLAETLGAEPGDVHPQSNFFSDLGGESIDLIDLGFRCQKTFGVTVAFQTMVPKGIETDDEGRLTPASRAAILAALPIRETDIPDGPFHYQQLVTARVLHELVAAQARFGRANQTASSPGVDAA